jgi:hypothetical protein
MSWSFSGECIRILHHSFLVATISMKPQCCMFHPWGWRGSISVTHVCHCYWRLEGLSQFFCHLPSHSK